MLTHLTAAALCGLAAWWWRWRVGAPPHPSLGDHEEYRRWRQAPRPFAWRWLVPALTRARRPAWRALVVVALVASGPALAGYLRARGASAPQALAGVAVWCCLPGVWERHAQVLHLVDAPALALALAAANTDLAWWWRVLAAAAAGATRETTPVLAAAFCLSPLPLAGLLAVPWWRGGRPWRNADFYDRPWRRFSRVNLARGFVPELHVYPLGGALPGVATTDLRVWAALAVAALPTLRSVDTARLVTHAAPALISSAVVGAGDGALVGMVALGLVLSSNWQA